MKKKLRNEKKNHRCIVPLRVPVCTLTEHSSRAEASRCRLQGYGVPVCDANLKAKSKDYSQSQTSH